MNNDSWFRLKGILKEKFNFLVLALLFIIAFVAVYIRTLNIYLLKDITTGKYIPIELDTFVFYRYSEYILQHGSLMANDVMRYFPLGYDPRTEFGFLSYFHAYTYKFLHIFLSNLTFDYWFVLYPVVCFLIMLLAFFFLVKLMFDKRVALLSTAFLAFSPSFLVRTIAGFSDKEALALMMMTFAILFYVSAWKSKSLQNALLFGIASGIFTAFTGLVWGGVIYLFFLFGFFGLIMVFLARYDSNGFYAHLCWHFSMIVIYLIFEGRWDLKSLLVGMGILPVTLSAILGSLLILLKKYEINYLKDLYKKIPKEVFALFLIFFLALFLSFLTSFNLIGKIGYFLYTYLIEPSGVGRWGLTVVESKEAYIIDWQNYLSTSYFYLFIIAALILAYNLFKKLGRYKNYFFFSFLFFLLGLVFTKYSKTSFFDGISIISKLIFFVFLLIYLFVIGYYYFYGFYRDKNLYNNILELDNILIFILLWFLIAVVAAKTKLRLIMMLVPITSIMVAYLFIHLFDKISNLKQLKLLSKPIEIFNFDLSNSQHVKIFSLIILFLFLLSPFAPIVNSIPVLNKFPIINEDGILISFVKNSYSQAIYSGPTVPQKWLKAMSWVRDNTPKDAVFGSWWDYGYWIQTLGERATISDGGNARGAINYLTGRYLFTSNNDTETLEFLYANNVKNIIFSGEDIGKYHAFSSIGSDLNYDRYSWINTFWLNPKKSEKKDNLNYILYEGNTPFDENYVFNNITFNRKESGIVGINIAYKSIENKNQVVWARAFLVVSPSPKIHIVQLDCVIVNGEEFILGNDGLKGCFVIVPIYLSKDITLPLGSGIYISEKVRKSIFGRYYLLGKTSPYFELIYNGEDVIPLASDSQKTNGPVKIWKVNYPKDIKDHPFYRKTLLPDDKLYYVNPEYQ